MGALWEGLKELLAGSLAFFYDLVPSFGLGIIFLTIAINLLLFPLTLKQTRATRAFQAIQPEIKRVQKELKDKPEEMQKELMRIQREAGASPGGCLVPLLVQMPIWFALFRVLSSPLQYLPEGSGLAEAVAADASTFLGMHMGETPGGAFSQDIVTALPYLMMMVLMVASQYVQTWHSTYGQEKPSGPQAGAQQAMTKIMPLFIGFISWNFPAGLVLYWATANLFRLGQQVVIFKIDGRPTPAAALAEGTTKPSDDDGSLTKKPQPGSKKRQGRRRRS
ncbi:MAG TPA: YidC/Oxa1 family membrane protein insertase [Acidimicrobiia bacterium]|nr:YidC/Oxa1 family membrane protein insertase [Acidimicrobiia bacterium]